jgi:hypothetical protein
MVNASTDELFAQGGQSVGRVFTVLAHFILWRFGAGGALGPQTLDRLHGAGDVDHRSGQPIGTGDVAGFGPRGVDRQKGVVHGPSKKHHEILGPVRGSRPAPLRLVPISCHAQTIADQRHKARWRRRETGRPLICMMFSGRPLNGDLLVRASFSSERAPKAGPGSA